MTLTEIKKSLFGYNQQDVCRYVSELNEIHTATQQANEEKLERISGELNEKNNKLIAENEELKSEAVALNTEISELKAVIESLKTENQELKTAYETLDNEVSDLRSKSDVISTAIINAEKCATTLIDDATNRANTMVLEAQDKVSEEVKRLETAKQYISEIKESVSLTMKNIENALTAAENDIANKKADVEDSSKKVSAREKFELLEKNIFKRA